VQTASAVLGDVVSILAGDAPVHETRVELPIVEDVSSSFYLHLEVADRPGVLALVAAVLGDHEISVKSFVQRGSGSDARLVMVIHECLESRFAAAVEELGRLEDLRSPPRSIRVIEEEYSA
jgi:homoserine dehydrogenase